MGILRYIVIKGSRRNYGEEETFPEVTLRSIGAHGVRRKTITFFEEKENEK